MIKATKPSMMKTAPLPAVIKHLLDLSGSTAAVEIHQSAGGKTIAGGKYSLTQHKITLYWDGIEEQCRILYGSLKPFDQHLAAVFAHELGHAEDPELNVLADQLDLTDDPLQRKRLALRIETNAWDYANRLLKEENSEFLQFLMHVSLEPYHGDDAA